MQETSKESKFLLFVRLLELVSLDGFVHATGFNASFRVFSVLMVLLINLCLYLEEIQNVLLTV